MKRPAIIVLALLVAISAAVALWVKSIDPPAPGRAGYQDSVGLLDERGGEVSTYLGHQDSTLGYVAHRAVGGADRAIVYLHGIESHAGWFHLAGQLLSEQGFDVFCLDRRGSGINREGRGFATGHGDDADVLLDDVGKFLSAIAADYREVVLVGLSWGGKYALAYALEHPHTIDALVLITPGIAALVDVTPLEKVVVGVGQVVHPRARVKTPIEPQQFTTTARFLDYIRRDPLRLSHVTAGFLWQSLRMDRMLEGASLDPDLPVLLYLAGRDTIIDNAAVLDMLERIISDQLTIIDYPDQTHSVQFDAPERMVNDLTEWLATTQVTTQGQP